MLLSEKQALRRAAAAARNAIPLSARMAISNQIQSHLTASEEYRHCEMVLTYLAFRSEIETRAIILHALAHNKSVALPRCSGESMEFYRVASLDALVSGPLGTLEPQPDSHSLVSPPANALCLVPGLLFDSEGYRLGYGGGYYDSFLARHDVLSVGLTYACMRREYLPRTANDRPVQLILTELGFDRICKTEEGGLHSGEE